MDTKSAMPSSLAKKLALPFALLVLAVGLFALSDRAVSAQEASASSIKVMEASITSEFPEGFRVKIAAEGENDIKQIALRMRIGQRTRGVYEYMGDEGGLVIGGRGRSLELTPGKSVRAELYWRTGSTTPSYRTSTR